MRHAQRHMCDGTGCEISQGLAGGNGITEKRQTSYNIAPIEEPDGSVKAQQRGFPSSNFTFRSPRLLKPNELL